MTASSEPQAPVTVEALLEVLERERRYYEVLRDLASRQRAAMAAGREAEMDALLSQEEPQALRAAEATRDRLDLEGSKGADSPELREARARALKSLRLFSVENRQNLETARRRLEEIRLAVGALSSAEERPAYPGAASPAEPVRPLLDRKA